MAKTKRRILKNQTKKRHSGRRAAMTNPKKSHLVKVFFEMLNTVKLYHWKTRSYAEHKATDELYDELNKNIDRFIEVLLGKDASRIKMVEKRINLIDSKNGQSFKSRIFEYRQFLIDMHYDLDPKRDSDLLAIRDDILENINQFLYLMTFH
jgi:DNA-binding ferritin-like protein